MTAQQTKAHPTVGRNRQETSQSRPRVSSRQIRGSSDRYVRTFGETLRHIAFWNHYLAETLRGKEADGNANELPHADYRTRPRIIEALELTSREVLDVLTKYKDELDQKSAEQVLAFIEHNCEHYGQLAVYSRLAGVIPPASR